MSVGGARAPLSSYKGHYFIELTGKKKSRLKAFEEVRDECFTALLDEMRSEMAHEKAQSLTMAISRGDSLEHVAAAESLEVKTAGPFNRSGYVVGIGREATLVGASFAGSVGGPPLAVKGTRGSYVVRVDDIQEPDPAVLEQQVAGLAVRLAQQKQSQAYSEWMARLEEKSDIEDFRDGY
jgi:hypothetical protein